MLEMYFGGALDSQSVAGFDLLINVVSKHDYLL